MNLFRHFESGSPYRLHFLPMYTFFALLLSHSIGLLQPRSRRLSLCRFTTVVSSLVCISILLDFSNFRTHSAHSGVSDSFVILSFVLAFCVEVESCLPSYEPTDRVGEVPRWSSGSLHRPSQQAVRSGLRPFPPNSSKPHLSDRTDLFRSRIFQIG